MDRFFMSFVPLNDTATQHVFPLKKATISKHVYVYIVTTHLNPIFQQITHGWPIVFPNSTFHSSPVSLNIITLSNIAVLYLMWRV